MARYIDADRALTKAHELFMQPNIELWQVCNLIENAPAADVAEVVRCKECIYWENGKGYTPYCNHPDSMLMDTNADDFCSYGERKER